MDSARFDAVTKTLTTTGSRRRALGGLLLGALGPARCAFSADQAVAAKKKKPCPPCKKRKKGKCKGTLPDGTGCKNGGQCQGGNCVPPGPPVVAYQCTNGNGRLVPDPPGSRLAQTFEAAAGGQLVQAEVLLISNVAGADLEFELRSLDASGQPAAVLTTTTVADVPATILGSEPRTVTALFNAGTLVAGEEYALTVREVNAGDVSFRIRIGGECGGRLYQASPQTPFRFEFIRDIDLALAVFVRT